MIAGASGVACTAIVLGTIGDKGGDDYDVGDPAKRPSSSTGDSSGGTSSGSTSSSSGKPDPCSLLTPQNGGYNGQYPDNQCAQCIQDSCPNDVQHACGDADGKNKKNWFRTLASCAQNPWIQYPAPGSSGSFWGCGSYDQPQDEIGGTDDQHYQRQSEICVYENCVQDAGAETPCRLCEVNTSGTSSSGEVHLLKEDPCGKCFTDNCNKDIVACCDSRVIDDYVRPCANTYDGKNLATCKKIADGDAGAVAEEHGNSTSDRYGPSEWDCVRRFSNCWNNFCSAKAACNK